MTEAVDVDPMDGQLLQGPAPLACCRPYHFFLLVHLLNGLVAATVGTHSDQAHCAERVVQAVERANLTRQDPEINVAKRSIR